MSHYCRLNKQRCLVEAYRLPWTLEQIVGVSLNLAKVVGITKRTVVKHDTLSHTILVSVGRNRPS